MLCADPRPTPDMYYRDNSRRREYRTARNTSGVEALNKYNNESFTGTNMAPETAHYQWLCRQQR